MHININDACWCGSGKCYKDCHKEFDTKIRTLSKNHKMIAPSRDLIKSEKDILGIKEAAKINIAVLDCVAKMIKEGITTEDINTLVHNKTIELGGIPAPLNYEGYPKSVCTSINEVVCHGIPDKNRVLKNGDIINVDCTTILNGYYADASRMFVIGEASLEAVNLVRETKEAVDLVVKKLKPYQTVGDIGYLISNYLHKLGYSIVREVGGHGVGCDFHEEPFVAHVGKKDEGMILAPGMVFTIEPMVNLGSRHVYLDSNDGWTIYTADGSLSAQWEYTVLMTEEGLEIIAY
jgi:methionyl aminopeptidase